MKIFTGAQVKAADRFTIENEPVSSLELMERASEALAREIAERVEPDRKLLFVIGKGNNGGDGLAIARMLFTAGFDCAVAMLYPAEELSEDCRFNFDRLPEKIQRRGSDFRSLVDERTTIIDAILGTGVKGSLSEYLKNIICTINSLGTRIISIDLPSGMKTEYGNDPEEIIQAGETLTIEFPKLAMLLPEAGECCGDITIVPVGLDRRYFENTSTEYAYLTPEIVASLLKGRKKFSHKGDFGHVLLICGSKEMPGAAVLSTGSSLRSGAGLVTTHVPSRAAEAISVNTPSAMISHEPEDVFTSVPKELERFTVCGVGCGLGKQPATKAAIKELLQNFRRPMVIDADALNIIAENPDIKKLIPESSILTPHPGEFRRLAGDWGSEEEKIGLLKGLAKDTNSIVVLKGAYTAVCMPDGSISFNSTGTPGMAKGGSGDVLTGLITGFVARGYNPTEAATIGVFIHGRAGEKAADYYGMEGMNSSDIIDFIGEAMSELKEFN